MKFEDRKNRLNNIMKGIEVITRCPLLHESKLQDSHVHSLRASVCYYVYVSLTNSFPQEKFTLDENVFDRYEKQIEKLVNITPNGLILPKLENFLAYHEIHKGVVNVLENYNMDDRIKLIHNPVNVRLVSGENKAGDRPKASTKLHTDIWAGEFSNSLMIFMPLMGDIANIGVDFYEPPQEFYPDYVKILDDYSEGAHFLELSDQYDCPLRNGYFYLIDSFLLHKTFKKKLGWRLSLDFRFLPKEELASDLKVDSVRNENYIPYDQWKTFGKTRLLFTDMPIDKFDSGRDKNAYAGQYNVIKL